MLYHAPMLKRMCALMGLVLMGLFWVEVPRAMAQDEDPRLDAETGQDRRVWPPDVLVDYTRMRLTLEIPDMGKPRFTGVQELWFTGVGRARDGLTLDCGPGLTVKSVESFAGETGSGTAGGAACEFDRPARNKLAVKFASPLAVGATMRLRIAYDADRPGGQGEGLTFSTDDRRTPEEDFMCHAQGQPQSNHLWFPCHDFPNDRLATELVVTVPFPYEAVSNGRLEAITWHPAVDGGARRRTYHWVQDAEHPFYLVTMVVSRFDVANLGGPGSARPGMWMPVYGALGSEEAIRRNFANTPAMITHFEELFGMAFPWDKYAQILCRDFAAGAMENTSASTFATMFGRAGAGGMADGIIAHELVHQWFGDLVTCRSWEHLWLNEGWATFGEALWAEKHRGRARYEGVIFEKMSAVLARTSGRTAPRATALVTNLYRNPDQRFYAAENPYDRGGVVLHMLRKRLGEDLFWKGVREYLKQHQFNEVETDDFRFALEEASGESLERFFDQWVMRPGHPKLAIDLAWDEAESRADEAGSGRLRVRVEQLQTIDGYNPAYAFVLPLWLELPEGDRKGRTVFVMCDSRQTDMVFELPGRPASVSIDPGMTVLCDADIRQDLVAWMRQLEHGPSVAARARAAAVLAVSDDPHARAALAAVLDAIGAESDELPVAIAAENARMDAAGAMAGMCP